MPVFYIETFTADKWWPQLLNARPKVNEQGRVVTVNGQGKQVRRVHEVPADLLDKGWTLRDYRKHFEKIEAEKEAKRDGA